MGDEGGDPEPVDRGAGQVHVLGQRVHLERRAAAAAVLGGPAGGDVTGLGLGPVQAPVVHGAGVVGGLDDLVGDVLVEERPDLLAEGADVGAEAEVDATLGGVGPVGVGRRDRAALRVGPEPAGEGDELAGRVAEQEAAGLGPAEVQLDVVLLHEPVAAVHVQRPRRGAGRCRPSRPVGHDRERRLGGVADVQRPHGLVRQQVGAVEVHGQVGEAVLDHLERADGGAELEAFGGVLDADGLGLAAEADEPAGRQRPVLVERECMGGPGLVARGEHDVSPAVVE